MPCCDQHSMPEACQLNTAIGAVRYSAKIRNQYAHANWVEREDRLCFIDFEAGAKTHVGDIMLSLRAMDTPLLRKQEAYLSYAFDWLFFLQQEHQVRSGKLERNSCGVPKILDQPPLYAQ
jgi:hypothetical protein